MKCVFSDIFLVTMIRNKYLSKREIFRELFHSVIKAIFLETLSFNELGLIELNL